MLRVKMKALLCWVQGLHLLFGIKEDRLAGTMNGWRWPSICLNLSVPMSYQSWCWHCMHELMHWCHVSWSVNFNIIYLNLLYVCSTIGRIYTTPSSDYQNCNVHNFHQLLTTLSVYKWFVPGNNITKTFIHAVVTDEAVQSSHVVF